MNFNSKFQIPIYGVSVFVFFGEDLDAARKEMNRVARIFISDPIGNAVGEYIYSPMTSTLVLNFARNKFLLGNIYHECTHGAFHVLDSRGIPHTMETDEAFVYLGQYIFEQTVKAFQKNKAL